MIIVRAFTKVGFFLSTHLKEVLDITTAIATVVSVFVAAFAFVFSWWSFRKQQKSQDEIFVKQQEAQQEAFDKQHDEVRKAFLRERVQEFTQQCRVYADEWLEFSDDRNWSLTTKIRELWHKGLMEKGENLGFLIGDYFGSSHDLLKVLSDFRHAIQSYYDDFRSFDVSNFAAYKELQTKLRLARVNFLYGVTIGANKLVKEVFYGMR